jgi:hypothetical protein
VVTARSIIRWLRLSRSLKTLPAPKFDQTVTSFLSPRSGPKAKRPDGARHLSTPARIR